MSSLKIELNWVVLACAAIIAVGSLASGLGGSGGNGVWHTLYDVSRTPGGHTSVDPNQNGDIDFIEDNIVTSAKVADGSIQYVDVDPDDICAVNSFDVPSPACAKATLNTGCSIIFNGQNGGAVNIPDKCRPNDVDASGSCVLVMTLIPTSGAAIHYGKWTQTQFDDPGVIMGQGLERWFATDRAFYPSSGVAIFNPVGEPEPSFGLNGDSVTTNITQPGFVQSDQGQSVSNIVLEDDNPTYNETSNSQWYMRDTNPNYSVRLEVC